MPMLQEMKVRISNYHDLESEADIANEIGYSRYSSWFKLIDVSAQVNEGNKEYIEDT